jgi:type I restriction enzyme, S subunit
MIDGLKPYPEYKESGLPWLGKLPQHWQTGPGFAAFREKHIRNNGMQEKRVLSLSYGRIVVKPSDKLHGLVPESFETYQIVEPGDIVIRSTDLQNDWNSLRVGFVKDRGIITSAYMCLKTTGKLIPEYGYLALHAFDLMKVFYGMGSGLRQNLDFSDFKRMLIFTPPLDDQAAIVKFLDHATCRINGAIRAKQKVIALLNEQKQVIIHRAVTRGLNPNVELKPSGIPWLGDIPKHWEFRRAKQLCFAIIDCKNRTPDMVLGGEFTVIRTTNIREGSFHIEGSYPTDHHNYKIWTQRGAPRFGDVFFTREAPAGEACLVPEIENLCMGQRMMYFRPNPAKLDARFLVNSIYGPVVRAYIANACSGSTVGHLRLGQVSSLPLLWCPVEEQKAIVLQINNMTAPLEAVITSTENQIRLLREFRSRLTTDVVTGKLDVREAARQLPDEGLEIEPETETISAVEGELQESETMGEVYG